MQDREKKIQSDLYRKLKWLIFFRALFASVLLCSSIIVGYNHHLSHLQPPLIFIYGISIGILALSLFYAIVLRLISNLSYFGYFQLTIDVCCVSGIILLTGGFSSVFLFLYLLVIIYASMITLRKGAMAFAIMSTIQYGLLVDLEYYGVIIPYGFNPKDIMMTYSWSYVVYKLVITTAACFAIAILCGYLAAQERRAKQDLWAMEDQVKRVEKLAAVGEMASGLAHEIKNPLASLSGSIQVLKEEIPYEERHDQLMEIVLRETNRISALVNDFLMFARPHPGKVKTIELSQTIADIIGLFQADSRRNRKITITKNLVKDIHISIDPDQLRQVMWNLLLNAEESIEKEGCIDISINPIDKKYVAITVTDTGCGISEDILKLIFDPFFTRKPKGTGLGLSIVQRIVSSHNGLVDVTSAPGKGTSFMIKFPRVVPSHTA